MSIQLIPVTDYRFVSSEQNKSLKDESFCTCIQQIFTVFWNTIRKLIADIQAFLQNLAEKETGTALKNKNIQAPPVLELQTNLQTKPFTAPLASIRKGEKTPLNKMGSWGVQAERPAAEPQPIEQPGQLQPDGEDQSVTTPESSMKEKIKTLLDKMDSWGVQAEQLAAEPQPIEQPGQLQPDGEDQSITTPESSMKEKVQPLFDKMDSSDVQAEEPIPEPQPAGLTAYEREHRIRTGTADIQARIEREWQHAQNQMAREKDKHFIYRTAYEQFVPPVQEERIGNYEIGLCHYQGPRPSMEDEHLAKSFNIKIAEKTYDIPLFAIMDGHGGRVCAEFIRDNLQETLEETLTEFNAKDLSDEGIWNALKHTGVRLHERFCAKYYIDKEAHEKNTSGSTLVFSIILDGKLWTANIGDSRAVLDNNGMAFQLSEDAKPADPKDPNPEITRYNKGVENRDGTIRLLTVWRVNGELACARAIGDPTLDGANSARAKITMTPLKSLTPNSHIILGCDGIFDVASTKEIVQAVHENRSLTLGALAKNIVFSTATSNSNDNQSLLIVKLA